jgi:hypothetical protein
MWEQPKALAMPIKISKKLLTLEKPFNWFVILSNTMFLLNIEIGLIAWFII